MLCGRFPGGSGVKNLPAMQETSVLTLGLEDPLEKKMATHSFFTKHVLGGGGGFSP